MLCSVQYVVSLLFASLCYFLIIGLVVFNPLYVCFLVLYVFSISLYSVFCIVLFVFSPFVYSCRFPIIFHTFTDHCHRVENHLQ